MEEADARSAIDGGVFIKNLPRGALLSIVTTHNVYWIAVVDPENGEVAIEGGILSAPRLFQLIGSTFGGSMIKIGWVGTGMFLKCYGFQSSHVQSVRVETDLARAQRIVAEATKNTAVLTKEEVRETYKAFLRENFKDPLTLRRVRDILDPFCLAGKICLSSFLKRAQDVKKIEKALEVAEGLLRESWIYQHREMRGNPYFGNNAHYLAEAYERTGLSFH